MKIASSEIAMASSHSSVVSDQKYESLRMWADDSGDTGSPAVNVTISDLAKQLAAGQADALAPAEDDYLLELSDKDKQKIRLIEDLIYAISGKRIKFAIPKKFRLSHDQLSLQTGAGKLTVNLGEAAARQRVGWGLNYEYHASHYEKEQTAVASSGVVKTADGREIKFDIAYAMSREYSSRTDISIKAGDALVDPLVINFAVPTASLTAGKYAFDLDSDGDKEQISFVGQGSGFLALDKNGDGVVNNGSELFGPESGNGFDDLAAYDADGNNWIDENDAIYSQLSIWTKDENGNDRLLALGQTGVGAIYLGNVGAAFSYKDTANQLQGQLQRSGVFLHEDGRAGTIQQIDLAV